MICVQHTKSLHCAGLQSGTLNSLKPDTLPATCSVGIPIATRSCRFLLSNSASTARYPTEVHSAKYGTHRERERERERGGGGKKGKGKEGERDGAERGEISRRGKDKER